MTPLPLPEILTATGGTLWGVLPAETRFPRLERDSRRVKVGDLFLAVRGEQYDGHHFVADAAAKGAR
ncbi:MAG: UDP-N-acetylmuramoylalanyl-D-glutamate--2,6-diaminopimelate ligase, partial [Chloroflexia bacterium]|nr:UDP-N-acetylmuramoylalanyl-D-glutamate--2,6-diaminopimelate ligase [Chloroflexia bacterium]